MGCKEAFFVVLNFIVPYVSYNNDKREFGPEEVRVEIIIWKIGKFILKGKAIPIVKLPNNL